MDILNISKTKNEATVILNSTELVTICNCLYRTYKDPEKRKNDSFYRLYDQMMLVRDLSQYGHIDGFCLSKIIECRDKIGKYEEVENDTD